MVYEPDTPRSMPSQPPSSHPPSKGHRSCAATTPLDAQTKAIEDPAPRMTHHSDVANELYREGIIRKPVAGYPSYLGRLPYSGHPPPYIASIVLLPPHAVHGYPPRGYPPPPSRTGGLYSPPRKPERRVALMSPEEREQYWKEKAEGPPRKPERRVALMSPEEREQYWIEKGERTKREKRCNESMSSEERRLKHQREYNREYRALMSPEQKERRLKQARGYNKLYQAKKRAEKAEAAAAALMERRRARKKAAAKAAPEPNHRPKRKRKERQVSPSNISIPVSVHHRTGKPEVLRSNVSASVSVHRTEVSPSIASVSAHCRMDDDTDSESLPKRREGLTARSQNGQLPRITAHTFQRMNPIESNRFSVDPGVEASEGEISWQYLEWERCKTEDKEASLAHQRAPNGLARGVEVVSLLDSDGSEEDETVPDSSDSPEGCCEDWMMNDLEIVI